MTRALYLIAGMAALAGTVTTWRYYNSPTYCAEEGRIIPEDEWKGRILLTIKKEDAKRDADRKKGIATEKQNYLPQNIVDLLRRKFPSGGSDAQMIAVLTDYVRKHPLCCQIYPEMLEVIEEESSYYAAGRRRMSQVKPVTSLMILSGPEEYFFTLKDVKKYKKFVNNEIENNPIKKISAVDSIYAAVNSCVTRVIIWKYIG